jgi:hypothetical protein
MDKKAEAEEALKVHEQKVEISRTYIVPLSSFMEHYLIDDRHIDSLLAPYSDKSGDSPLFDWLGLGYDKEQIPDDLIDLLNVEESLSNMNIKDNEETKQTTDQREKIDVKQQEGEQKTEDKQQEGEQKTEDKQQEGEEKADDKKKENDDPEMNEEEEEELRRRDELDMEEEYFIKSAVQKPTTTESNSTTEQAPSKDNDDDDGQGKWQKVQKRPYDRRRLIRHIIQNPSTLDDKTIKQVNNDVWRLSMAQRHDLYRYWLFKYRLFLHFSVRDIRQAYNQAVAALAEYHQEEDYYILKDSVIVAMTTTCAAKYHTVIEKLRKRLNFCHLKHESKDISISVFRK